MEEAKVKKKRKRIKERTIICEDCGAEVVTRGGRAKVCPECAKKRQRERERKVKERKRDLNSIKKTFAPAGMSDQFCDTPENIQKCLNCTRPKCNNCLE